MGLRIKFIDYFDLAAETESREFDSRRRPNRVGFVSPYAAKDVRCGDV